MYLESNAPVTVALVEGAWQVTTYDSDRDLVVSAFPNSVHKSNLKKSVKKEVEKLGNQQAANSIFISHGDNLMERKFLVYLSL